VTRAASEIKLLEDTIRECQGLTGITKKVRDKE